jgi:hypothetical protein
VPILYHTAQSLADWDAADSGDPAMAKLRDLTVDYITAQGGLALEIWRLYMGPWFGERVMMTLEDAAKQLGISNKLAINVVRSTDAVILPRWRRSEEYRRTVHGG